jgi:hypothetical protein
MSSSKISSSPPLMKPESINGIGMAGRMGLEAGGLDWMYGAVRGTGGEEFKSPALSSGK